MDKLVPQKYSLSYSHGEILIPSYVVPANILSDNRMKEMIPNPGNLLEGRKIQYVHIKYASYKQDY